jgi:molybdate transport system substrate-binding protein
MKNARSFEQLRCIAGSFAVVTLLAFPNPSLAQVKVIISGGFSTAYKQVLPEFEKTTGITVTTGSGASQGTGQQTIAAQLQRGEPADVVIMSRDGLADLMAAGRIVVGSDVDLARVPLGAAVRVGAPKPDVGSVEALKKTLLNAKTVAVPASTGGIYLKTKLLPQLGIADQVNVKAMERGSQAAAMVADGGADLVIQPVSELMSVSGIEVVGLLPSEVQLIQPFAAAIVVGAKEPDKGKRLIEFLASERAVAAIEKNGMEPARKRATDASSAPCVSPISSCIEWLTVPGTTGRLMLYRTYPLDAKNERITRALVVIHGAGRNADEYYRNAIAAGFLADALDNTIIITPRFASGHAAGDDRECRDKLAADELSWHCEGKATWKNGGAAVSEPRLTSFDVADEIVRLLARREVFPNLRSIVIAGHSAGGQFAVRYAMANRAQDRVSVPISYVVANPSSYTYLDAIRPTNAAMVSRYPALPPGYQAAAAPSQSPFVDFADAKSCTGYNKWPYGLEERVGYTANLSDADLKRQLVARPVTYLLGELDILPLYGFDATCSAMAQGPTRLARGVAYTKYVTEILGAQHRQVIVPACPHNARCIFTSEVSLPVLFPKQ